MFNPRERFRRIGFFVLLFVACLLLSGIAKHFHTRKADPSRGLEVNRALAVRSRHSQRNLPLECEPGNFL